MSAVDESWLDDKLRSLRDQHLERQDRILPATGPRIRVGDRVLVNLASNDYLGLAGDPRILEAARRALEADGAGATASRLISGTLPVHAELEARLAAFKGYPAALVFGSGYLANTGVLPVLAGRDDHLFLDRLAHASLVDGAVLSRARIHRFRHNDADHLESLLRPDRRGRKLVVTESVFSMDGDLAPLAPMADLCDRHGAILVVDEAHATGVLGSSGRGLVPALGLQERVPVTTFTLGKALGSYGGAIACNAAMRTWIANRARPFVYSTAPPPAVMAAALAALGIVEATPELGSRLLAHADRFRADLQALGLDTLASASHIVPVRIGPSDRALAAAGRLEQAGVLAVAIRPPSVPAGTARIRFSLRADHTGDDLALARDAARQVLAEGARS
jgi:8-amino-7-oxononanoate synthase